jgi:hypothetical protein
MQRAIANGHAVCFAVFVDDDFEAWDPGPGVPLSTPNRGDPNGGLHYMYVIGFRTLKSGRVVFRFRNSWGTGWGMAGDGEGDELFTAGMSDIRVMAPKPRNWPKGIV